MEYKTSAKEIKRRKKAFLSLVAGLFAGIFLTSLLLRYPISGWIYLLIVAFLLFIAWLTLSFLNSVADTKLFIYEDRLETSDGRQCRFTAFSLINKLVIKRRSNGQIREIRIGSARRKDIILSALEEDFEDIYNILLEKAKKETKIREFKEPLDFDHILFYPILGLLSGFWALAFFRWLENISETTFKFILAFFSILPLGLSAYFLFSRPLTARNGKMGIASDFIFGLVLLGLSVFGLWLAIGM